MQKLSCVGSIVKQPYKRENIGKTIWSLNARIAIVRTSICAGDAERRFEDGILLRVGLFVLASDPRCDFGTRWSETSAESVCNGNSTC